MWKRIASDVEVSATDWLPEWNVPPAQRRSTRPLCSVHWAEGAEQALLSNDKVFRRETQSSYQKSLIYLLERNGKIVAVSEQVLWKMIE
jgi:hypothetical protein